LACVCGAGGVISLVIVFTPLDDSLLRPSDLPVSPESVAEKPRIVIPATAVAATLDELKHESMQVTEDLLARFPRSPEAHHVMALLQKAYRQTDDARAYWRECIELAPGHTRARIGLASIAVDQGKDELAVETLEEAISVGCSSPDVYNALATALMHLGRFDQAVGVLKKSPAGFPQSSEGWYLLGQAQIQRNEFQQAEKSLTTAIELAPEYTDAYYALAICCVRQGKHGDAAEHRRRFAKLKAGDREAEDRQFYVPDLDTIRQRTAAALCGAGTVYLQEGDRLEAERLLLRAAAVLPNFAETYKVLATLYQGTERIADALVVQRHLVEIDPKNVVNYLNLGNLYTRVGDMASAVEILKQAIELRPDAAVAYSCLAQLYLKTGDPERARSLAEEAVRRDRTAAGYVLLASACQRLNDNVGAEAALEEARKLSSNDPQREQRDGRQPRAK